MAKLYGGRWKVESSIGGGGQSDVFSVKDANGQFVGSWALKRLRRQERIARFQREVAVLERLDHPNIIKIIDAHVEVGGSDEPSYLVMPIAEHGDLNDRLPIYTGKLDSVVEVARQIADGLKCAHSANVIHRDIKPGNILFPDVGHTVWVADFGISLDQLAERHTPDGEVVGPRFFTAPELEDGGGTVATPAVDVYSLGQLVFYMLSGGKRIAREGVFDKRYDSYFSNGQRYHLLRLLLSKMIASVESRYGEMSRVLVDLEHIATWEKTAISGLLNGAGLKATEKLQKRLAEEYAQKQNSQSLRKNELQLISGVQISAIEWMTALLEATREQLSIGDVISIEVGPHDQFGRARHKIDTGNDTLLEEWGSVAISVGEYQGGSRRVYVTRFIVCAEVNWTLPGSDANYLGLSGNPAMAVVPIYSEHDQREPHLNGALEYYFGAAVKYGVPSPIPIFPIPIRWNSMTDSQFVDGKMAIARFNAADWPAAQVIVQPMMSDVVSRMMQSISD